MGVFRNPSVGGPTLLSFYMSAQACLALVFPPLSLLRINFPEVNGRKEGKETAMMMTLIFFPPFFCWCLGRVVVLLPGLQWRILCQTIISALSLLSDAPLTAQGRLLNGHQTSASIPSIVIKLGR